MRHGEDIREFVRRKSKLWRWLDGRGEQLTGSRGQRVGVRTSVRLISAR